MRNLEFWNYESENDGSDSEREWQDSQRILRTSNVRETNHTTLSYTNQTSDRKTNRSTANIRGKIQKNAKKHRGKA